MHQVLFRVPWVDLPIYGYGFMLFCAFLGCTLLAARLARRAGYRPEPVQDLVMWLFITGIIGARVTYIARYSEQFTTLWHCFAVWDGGLIFYGSIPGATIGYLLAYRFQLRRHGISHWRIADIVAPCLALGLCLGRLGCLLNGCCYGNVACTTCPSVTFPLSSPPRIEMVRRGHQTPAGFLTEPGRRVVSHVEPRSAAAEAGLKPGDTVVELNGAPVKSTAELAALGPDWPRGLNTMQFDVIAPDGAARTVGPFEPRSIGLHPTQIYESISGGLLLLLLLSFLPFQRRAGALMVLLMFGYGVHRFLNEMLRTDTEIVAFGMTLSQNVSVLVLIAAIVLALIVWRRPVLADPTPAGLKC